jgi:hypothetical protein
MRFHSSLRVFALAVTLGTLSPAWGADAPSSAESAPRFTFGDSLKPRGGTSQGQPVTIDRTPSAAWTALQAPGLAPRERDRRAILAMAGAWRVAFDFVEVASFAGPDAPDPKARAPYQSWGTEKVYVDRDDPGLISLVHILEMRIVGPDGKVSEPIVTKHWRQEWAYEPTAIVEYRGGDRWQRRAVDEADRRGAWSQTVLQVDESPRYASVGRWVHTPSFSTWISGDTWRPLPRREWTVRHDYQVLAGTNRHTIVPTGWLQEENNLKTVIAADRSVDAAHPYVGREYGVARYERIRDADFAAADHYYASTRAFWDRVEDTWNADFATRGTITLQGESDQKAFFVPLFERADRIETKGPAPDDDAVIRTTLDRMRAPGP